MNCQLLRKYLSGQCTLKEEEQVDEWLAADSKNKECFESLVKVWEFTPRDDMQPDVDRAWQSIEARLSDSEDRVIKLNGSKDVVRRSNFIVKFAVAASIIIMGIFLYQYAPILGKSLLDSPVEKVEMDTYATRKGQRTTLHLTDGSIVHLNVSSSLKIDPNFGDSIRVVYLEGEGYFQIAHNPNKPFIVRTKSASTKVLGTKFDVKSYPDDSTVQVVVKEGKVSLQNNIHTARKLLTKNKIGVLYTNGRLQVNSVASLNEYLGWKSGALIFANTPLRDIIVRLERWYNVDIVVENKKLLSQTITATFKNDTLEEVLEVLSISLNINYDITGRKVRLISPI